MREKNGKRSTRAVETRGPKLRNVEAQGCHPAQIATDARASDGIGGLGQSCDAGRRAWAELIRRVVRRNQWRQARLANCATRSQWSSETCRYAAVSRAPHPQRNGRPLHCRRARRVARLERRCFMVLTGDGAAL